MSTLGGSRSSCKRIVTHGGRAHRDDFLSVCIALYLCGAETEVVRRAPTPEELEDAEVFVLDVGGRCESEKANYDHHQFPRSAEPACTLSLLDKWFMLGLSNLQWFRFTEILDSKGPAEAAKLVYTDSDGLKNTVSPVESALISMFSEDASRVRDIMAKLGENIVEYADSIQRDFSALRYDCQGSVIRVAGIPGILIHQKVSLRAVEMFREYARFDCGGCLAAFSITPDDRGDGWSLFRYDDDPRLDFSRLEGDPDIVFAHKAGFVAKTRPWPESITELRTLVEKAVVIPAGET